MIVGGQFKTSDKQNYNVQDENKNTLFQGDRLNDQSAQFTNYNTQLLYKKKEAVLKFCFKTASSCG